MNDLIDVVVIYYMNGDIKNYVSGFTRTGKTSFQVNYTQAFCFAVQYRDVPAAQRDITTPPLSTGGIDYRTEWITVPKGQPQLERCTAVVYHDDVVNLYTK